MTWHRTTTDHLAGGLRFIVRAAGLVSIIALATGSAYVISKLTWWTVQYLDTIWFSSPW